MLFISFPHCIPGCFCSDDTSKHYAVVYTLIDSPGEALGVYVVGRGNEATVLLILE